MGSSSLVKIFNWGFRILELILAIILVADVSYIIDQWNKYTNITPTATLVVTLIASVFALAFSIIYIVGVFMGAVFHGISASIDFVVFTLYLTSIGLLAENFNSDHDNRPLVKSLSEFRKSRGLETKESLTNRLVSLLDALVIIQIILFFYSMLFSAWVAWRETKHKKEELRMARGNEKNLVPNVTDA